MKHQMTIEIEKFDQVTQLDSSDQVLLAKAQNATNMAYAPYSNFLVGAAALISNGELILGSNQENASYGATICAERVLLAALSVTHSKEYIKTIAVSYNNTNGLSNKPISPCGICRQALLEHEIISKNPIRIIMSGLSGEVWIINGATNLLPLGFSNSDMN